MPEKELGQIIAGCRKADEACFSQLVDIYSSRMFGYFYRLTGNRNTSDELLSELFAKLVERIGQFRGGSFDSWIFRVASNLFYDHLRDKQRQQGLIEEHAKRLEEDERSGRWPEAADDGGEDADRLQKQLGRVDEQTREVIMLRYYSDMSFKEIAEMRGEPIGTTISKVHRGLKKLRELME
jgi:RNA polymerase sigma-70 factor, ECF subfamily